MWVPHSTQSARRKFLGAKDEAGRCLVGLGGIHHGVFSRRIIQSRKPRLGAALIRRQPPRCQRCEDDISIASTDSMQLTISREREASGCSVSPLLTNVVSIYFFFFPLAGGGDTDSLQSFESQDPWSTSHTARPTHKK